MTWYQDCILKVNQSISLRKEIPMSQKILRWDNKHESVFYDASTPEKEAAAFLRMFQDMDEQEFYQFDVEYEEKNVTELRALKESVEKGQVPDALVKEAREKLGYLGYHEKLLKNEQTQKALHDRARQGDAKAARKLVDLRHSYEYENWFFEYVTDPLVPKTKSDDENDD